MPNEDNIPELYGPYNPYSPHYPQYKYCSNPCEHCYCLDEEPNNLLHPNRSKIPHKICCKCGDVMAEQFIE